MQPVYLDLQAENAGDGYPEAVENIRLEIIEKSRKDVSNEVEKKNPLQKHWQLGDTQRRCCNENKPAEI